MNKEILIVPNQITDTFVEYLGLLYKQYPSFEICVKELSQCCRVALYGGIIRNFLIKGVKASINDFDLVVEVQDRDF